MIFSSSAQSREITIENLVSKLPDKTVSLDFILALGVQRSQSFKALMAEFATTKNAELEAEASLDPVLSSTVSYAFAEGDTALGPMVPEETRYMRSEIALSKYFQTGTLLSFSLSRLGVDQDFAPSSFPLPLALYSDARWKLGLRQNLLKDMFGNGIRKTIAGSEKLSEAAEASAKLRLEDWALTLSGLYYQAWLARTQYQVAVNRRERQTRLLNVSTLQFKRGTLEEPDFLQIRSLNDESSLQLQDARRRLDDIWTQLVNNLGLPEEFLKIDPARVPMTLDSPEIKLGEVCRDLSRDTISKLPIRDLQIAKSQSEAGALIYEGARYNALPQLYLDAAFGGRGVDPQASDAISEAAKVGAKEYYVGVGLEWKFGDSAAKAQLLDGYKRKIQAEANLGSTYDRVDAEVRDLCRNFSAQQADAEVYARIVRDRKRRADLDERRFRIGRTDVTQVVRSGDELSLAQLASEQNNVALRMSLWKLRQMNQKMDAYFEGLRRFDLKGL